MYFNGIPSAGTNQSYLKANLYPDSNRNLLVKDSGWFDDYSSFINAKVLNNEVNETIFLSLVDTGSVPPPIGELGIESYDNGSLQNEMFRNFRGDTNSGSKANSNAEATFNPKLYSYELKYPFTPEINISGSQNATIFNWFSQNTALLGSGSSLKDTQYANWPDFPVDFPGTGSFNVGYFGASFYTSSMGYTGSLWGYANEFLAYSSNTSEIPYNTVKSQGIKNNVIDAYYNGSGSLTTTGLVGGWDASLYPGSGSIVDLVTGSRTFAIVGSPTIVSSSAGYIDFDGTSDYLTGSSGVSMNETIWPTGIDGQEYAIEILFNSDTYDNNFHTLASFWNDSGSANEIYRFGFSDNTLSPTNTKGNYRWNFRSKDNTFNSIGSEYERYYPKHWTHLVYNIRTNADNISWTAYQNNIMGQNKSFGLNTPNLKAPTVSGSAAFAAQNVTGDLQLFNGKIAAVRFYNRNLTRTEIDNNFKYFDNTRGYNLTGNSILPFDPTLNGNIQPYLWYDFTDSSTMGILEVMTFIT